jgi:hypothetical protein
VGAAPKKAPAAKKTAAAKPVAAKKTPATKAAPKPAAKTSSKVASTVAPKAAPASKAAPKAAAPKASVEKVRKAKLVRDSFTMPEAEYAVLAQVKKACLKAGFEIKKSELLRIGVAMIGQLDLKTLQAILAKLPQLKTGRPKRT